LLERIVCPLWPVRSVKLSIDWRIEMGINLPHGGCKWEGCNVCANIRIGYHRVSENSVTSAVLTKAELQERVEEILSDPDIDHYWTRNYWTMDILFDSKS